MENQDLVQILMSQATLSDPIRYANLLKASRSKEIENIREMIPSLKITLEQYEIISKKAAEFRRQVSGADYARRRKDASKIFDGLDQQKESARGPDIDISGIFSFHCDSMVGIYSALVQGSELIANARMVSLDESLNSWSKDLSNSSNELGEERIKAIFGKAKESTNDALQSLAAEQQLNRGASNSFIQGLMLLEKIPRMYEQYLMAQSKRFEAYYEKMRHRHSNGGMCIVTYGDEPSVTLTDISMLVWENIDKVGEIESGSSKDELSAYTLHRAEAMIDAAKNDDVWKWLIAPGESLISWANLVLPVVKAVHNFVIKMKNLLGESVWRLISLDLDKTKEEFVDIVESLNLSQITQKNPDRAYSKMEKFAMEHRNNSIQKVAQLLIDARGLGTIVREILELKIEERNYFLNENSFYVCRIGEGNMFAGVAPGGLEVIPGEKPSADLKNIWGSGFDELREFVDGRDLAKKWNNLFLATSPSKSTDKANVLLVGPQGCGKTLGMKAIACKPKSISIFLSGSDLCTAWAFESQKNPKRLFEEAVKLHKNSGHPVNILIDEIDMVLNNDERGLGKINLSLEFQNIMDGLISYPGISMWGATNNVEKIPTPMLRRFAKVLVVGELSHEETKQILKHYLESYLPCGSGFSDEQYSDWANMLEGATGDALRKGIDEVWLQFMRGVVDEHKELAEKILEFIEKEYGTNFEINSLSDDHRKEIHKMFEESGLVVTAELVTDRIEKLLDNSAVRKQIQVSKDTYRIARQTLDRQKSGEKGLGF